MAQLEPSVQLQQVYGEMRALPVLVAGRSDVDEMYAK